MKTDERNLTPVRAVPLLVELAKARGGNDVSTKDWALGQAIEKLEEHVQHGLSRAKRRRKK